LQARLFDHDAWQSGDVVLRVRPASLAATLAANPHKDQVQVAESIPELMASFSEMRASKYDMQALQRAEQTAIAALNRILIVERDMAEVKGLLDLPKLADVRQKRRSSSCMKEMGHVPSEDVYAVPHGSSEHGESISEASSRLLGAQLELQAHLTQGHEDLRQHLNKQLAAIEDTLNRRLAQLEFSTASGWDDLRRSEHVRLGQEVAEIGKAAVEQQAETMKALEKERETRSEEVAQWFGMLREELCNSARILQQELDVHTVAIQEVRSEQLSLARSCSIEQQCRVHDVANLRSHLRGLVEGGMPIAEEQGETTADLIAAADAAQSWFELQCAVEGVQHRCERLESIIGSGAELKEQTSQNNCLELAYKQTVLEQRLAAIEAKAAEGPHDKSAIAPSAPDAAGGSLQASKRRSALQAMASMEAAIQSVASSAAVVAKGPGG